MAKKFAKITGMSTIFAVGQDNKYDTTQIKSGVTDVDNYTICFITTTSSDATHGFRAGNNFIWTRGRIYGKSKVPVEGVTISDHTLSVVRPHKNATGSFTLSALVTPPDADNPIVTWSSSNLSVCSVAASQQGTNYCVGTAYTDGQADIIVQTLDGGLTDSCRVTVTHTAYPVESITITEGSAITITRTNQISSATGSLHAVALPDYAEDGSVTWTSSDNTHCRIISTTGGEVVFEVDADGQYTLTCSSVSNPGVTSACVITVNHASTLPTSIELVPDTMDLVSGFSDLIIIEVGPADADDKSVTWSTSDPSVATVSGDDTECTVTAAGAGTAIVTVTCNANPSATASCEVTVTSPTIIPSVNDLGIVNVGPADFQYGNYTAGKESFVGSWGVADTGVMNVSGSYNKTDRALGNFTYDMNILFENNVTSYLEFLESTTSDLQWVQLADDEYPEEGDYLLVAHEDMSAAGANVNNLNAGILYNAAASGWGQNARADFNEIQSGTVVKYLSSTGQYILECSSQEVADMLSSTCLAHISTSDGHTGTVNLSQDPENPSYLTSVSSNTFSLSTSPSTITFNSTDDISSETHPECCSHLFLPSQSRHLTAVTGSSCKFRWYKTTSFTQSSNYYGVRIFKKAEPSYMGYGWYGSYSPTSLVITPTIVNSYYNRIVLGLEIDGQFTASIKNNGTTIASTQVSTSGDIIFNLGSTYETGDLTIEITTSTPQDQTLGLRNFSITEEL